MSSIDTRIVDMKFNNAQFNEGVNSTLKALSNLQEGLKLDNISEGVDNISSKFSVLGAVGFSAINKLVSWSADAGTKLVRNIIDPIVEGGKKRSLNLEQAYFQLRGLLKTEEEVQLVMENVSAAVDGTAYGLDAAAVAASQFAASGIKGGQEMENALRGISGVAAMAGSSYEDVANIFTKVAGQGRLMGDDLNRLSARGINAASTLGKAMGKTEAEIRDMVSKGKISFEMFSEAMNDAFGDHATKANETYAGSLSNVKAALARVGQQYYRGIGNEESTGHLERQRKIFVSLIPIINGFAGALKLVMGPWNEVKNLKNDNFVKFLESFGTAEEITAKLAPSFQNIGDTIKALYEAVQSYLNPIKEAFRDVFPKNDNSPSIFLTVLEAITGALKSFAEALKLGAAGQTILYVAFRTLFTILKVGLNVLKAVGIGIKFLVQAFGMVASAVGQALQPIADWFSNLIKGFGESTKSGDSFFDRLTALSDSGLTGFAEKLAVATAAMQQFTSTRIVPFLENLRDRLQPVIDKLKGLDLSWDNVNSSMAGFGEKIKGAYETVLPYLQRTWEFVKEVSNNIKNLLERIGLDGILKIVATGGFIALIKMLSDTNKSFNNFIKGTTGILDKVKDLLGGVTEALSRMGNETPVKKIFMVASSLFIIAAALTMLSKLNAVEITTGLIGIASSIGIVAAGMKILSLAMKDSFSTKQLISFGVALFLVASGMMVFGAALKIISMLSWEEIAKGIAVVGVGLLALTKTINSIGGPHVLASAGSLLILSFALLTFAGVIKIYSMMSWETIGKGLLRISSAFIALGLALYALDKLSKNLWKTSAALFILVASLGAFLVVLTAISIIPFPLIINGFINVSLALWALSVAAKLMDGTSKDLWRTTAALIPLATALAILTIPLIALSHIPFRKLMSGMTTLAVGLAAMGVALKLMTKGTNTDAIKMMQIAGAFVILSSALLIMAIAIKKVAGIQLGGVVKAIASFTAVIGSLTIFMKVVQTASKGAKRTLASAASLILLSASLLIIAKGLYKLGSMDAGTLTKGLTAMVVALGLLGTIMIILAALGPVASLAAGAAVIIGGAGLWLVAESLAKLGTVNFGNIEENLSTMIKALALVTVASMAASAGAAGAATIVIAAFGLGLLAEAMQKWSTVSIPPGIGAGLAEIALGVFAFTPAILGAVSALVSGFALVKLAEGLRSFNGVTVPENFAASLKNVAEGIRAFTIGDLISSISALVAGNALVKLGEGIQSWSGVTVRDDIGEQLTKLADGIRAFEGTVMAAISALISGSSIKDLAEAVKAWEGVQVNPDIETQLKGLARGIEAFNDGLVGAITALIAEASIADLADGVRAWEGVEVNPAIEEQLKSLARGIEAFNSGLIGAISMAIADDSIAKFADGVRAWEGIELNPDIETQLVSLANGVKSFTLMFTGAGNMNKSIEPLKEMAGAVKAWQNVSVPSTIEEDLRAVANGVKAFKETYIDPEHMLALMPVIKQVPSSVAGYSNLNIPTNLKEQMKSLKDGINEIGGLSVEKLEGIQEPLRALHGSVSTWSSLSVPPNITIQLSMLVSGIEHLSTLDISESLITNLMRLGASLSVLGNNTQTMGTNVLNGASSLASGVTAIVTSVTLLDTKLNSVKTSVNSAVNSINTSVSKIGDGANKSMATFALAIVVNGTLITASIKTTATAVSSSMRLLGVSLTRETTSATKAYTTLQRDVSVKMTLLLSTVTRMSALIVAAMSRMSTGIQQASRNAANAINNSVRTVVNGAIATLSGARSRIYSASYSVGLAVGQGMAQGIYSGRSSAISAASSVAYSALAAAKRTLAIRSPSRKAAELGSMFTLGFAVGLNQNESKVSKATEALGNSALSTMLRFNDELQTLLDNGMISDPVITPVLDLSTLKNQASGINGILNPNQSLQQAGGLEREYATARSIREGNEAISSTANSSVVFNQYNTSPKALSAADIYRRTRNQLAMARKS